MIFLKFVPFCTDHTIIYRSSLLCRKTSKQIIFQCTVLQRRLAMESFFFFKQKINIRGNEQCTFCQNDTKTLIHLFLVLSHFQSFLARVWAMAVNRGEMSNTIKGEGHSKKHIFLSSPIKKVYIELSYSPKFQSLKCLLSQEICLQSSLKFGIGNRHFETNA